MNYWYCSIITHLCFYLIFNSTICESNNISSNTCLDKLVLNCGSSGSSSFNGKYWIGDVGSKFIPADSDRTTISAASTPINEKVPQIPYLTARLCRFRFAYAFPFSPGYKFIRLHFYPASYSGLDRNSKASFSVVSGKYTLLNNFSPSPVASTSKLTYFTKEFVVNLKENLLNITFIPSPKAYAFVNGLEIYNLPSNFYNYSAHNDPAFEMLHRVNVGGSEFIESIWPDDSSYILGFMSGQVIHTLEDTQDSWNMSEYAVPTLLYASARTMDVDDAISMTYNLTWTFFIDSGFKYLVRLHFCEISYEVTGVNQRVFTVYINNRTVENSLDVVALAGAPLVAIYRDYIVMVPQGTGEKQDLWLALHPNTESKPMFKNAILNGVEIMKFSDANNNLAPYFQPEIGIRKKKILLIVILGGILGCLGGSFICCYFVYRCTKRKSFCSRDHSQRNSKRPLITQSGNCREFKLVDMRVATNNFSEALVIGVGGFGKVYKGLIDGGTIQVAVKRKHSASHQGFQEFLTEINLLSAFRHTNLVSLLGFCQEDNELILVYDYMSHGTLRDYLYKKDNSPLSWNQRLKICIGAARGLHYLHTGTKHSIIHRDIKSTNILLDDEWVAKVSDFGLSRIGPTTSSRSHVKTEVKGTFGYLDPVYYRTRTLSKKSDVYSFGVLLLEVLCARPAIVEGEEHKVSLAEWALHYHQSGAIDFIVDPFLRGKITFESMTNFVEIAVKCLADQRAQRPLMSDVLYGLELSLQLQERADADKEV
ncbi:conserved hypothetical protein [Ricinus communis]|uniref:Protein kinase domain-containing protein n=1 Tax=Ricinus communis TaxID=3988 RepID=B9REA5_RICCO|nr:conserved hypothetical protein [Ricinus communis]